MSLIPGPNEPKGDINSFLQLLVGELLHFLDGVPMSVHRHDGLQEVKCALFCVANDLPAARKVWIFRTQRSSWMFSVQERILWWI